MFLFTISFWYWKKKKTENQSNPKGKVCLCEGLTWKPPGREEIQWVTRMAGGVSRTTLGRAGGNYLRNKAKRRELRQLSLLIVWHWLQRDTLCRVCGKLVNLLCSTCEMGAVEVETSRGCCSEGDHLATAGLCGMQTAEQSRVKEDLAY